MPETIITSFDSPSDAGRAVKELRREGFAATALTLMSSEPLAISVEDAGEAAKSRIGLFAVAGGMIGAVGALALTISASQRIGLVVGGMPIITPWPFGIVTFELAALGAILAALVRLIIEARLARRGALTVYDEAVADGRIVLAVECRDEGSAATASRVLAGTSGAELKRT